MHVEIVEGWDEFDQLRSEWDAIYGADPEAQVFLSWQWLADWLNVYRSRWFILAAKRDQAATNYVGFLPVRNHVVFHKKTGFCNEISLAGAQFSDYTGVLVRPDLETETLRAFAKYLKRDLKWARFNLDGLMMSERRRQAFLSAFAGATFNSDPIDYRMKEGTDNSVCPRIELPATWDDYLGGLSVNNRQKIRRHMRKVDAANEYRIVLSDTQSYGQNLNILLNFWKKKWGSSKGEKINSIVACNYNMLMRCADNGTLLLPVFLERERPVAALAILIDPCKRSLLFLIGGRDDTYMAMPAGYLLHAYSIRHAIAHGFVHYDFGKGDEPYKYQFGAHDRHINPIAVHRVAECNLENVIDSGSITTMLEMALAFEDAGEMEEAELGYRQILKVALNNALAFYRVGRFLAKTDAHEEATRFLGRSVEIEPKGDNAWFWLARSQQSLGYTDAARDSCRKAILLEPGNDAAKMLLLRLTLYSEATSPAPQLAGAFSSSRIRERRFDAVNALQELGINDHAKDFKL